MTSRTIQNNMSVFKSPEGEPKAIMIDISNAQVKEYFEDLMDSLEAELRMNEGGGIPFADYKAEYLVRHAKQQ